MTQRDPAVAFVADAAAGMLAYAVVYFLEIPLAVSRTWVPWVIAPLVLAAAGALRGGAERSVWAKGDRVNLGNWVMTFWMLTGFDRWPGLADWREALPWMAATFVSTVCGIAARRGLAALAGG